MTTSFVFATPDNLDFNEVEAGYVRTAFILMLPFRVRTGKLFRLTVDPCFEVVFRNKLDIPHGTSVDDVHKMMWIGTQLRPREDFFTEAMIIDRKPPVDATTAKRFAEWLQQQTESDRPSYKERYFSALSSLNDAIVIYHSATQAVTGGGIVERLTTFDFFERLRYLNTIVCPPDYDFSEEDIHGILDARAEREFTRIPGQFSPDIADFSLVDIDKISNHVYHHITFLFYQFALDATSKMREQDFTSAILFAAVALEGAHAVLLQMCLDRIMGQSTLDHKSRAKLIEAKKEELLTEVGFSKMVEMTSTLFLEEADRPKITDVKACQKGISIRNGIMHAIAKKGQYRFRNTTSEQITQAIVSMFTLYKHFLQIIERAITTSPDQQQQQI